MPAFPTLKTGAVAQHPARRGARYSVEVHRFVDGTEQRYATDGAKLRVWTLSLDLLEPSEAAAVRELYDAVHGASATFSFSDPFDGTVYPHCVFDGDALEIEHLDELRAGAELRIREVRV